MIYYRAMPIEADEVRGGDYITPSLRFAREHAITTSVYEEEDYGVFAVVLDESETEEASNPGEYIYKGEGKKARLIGIAKYNEDHANSEYQRVKPKSKEHLSPRQTKLALLDGQPTHSKIFAQAQTKESVRGGDRWPDGVTNIRPLNMNLATNKLNNLNVWLKTAGFDHESRELEGLVKESVRDMGPDFATAVGAANVAEQKMKALWPTFADDVQLALSAIGFLPVVGEAADALNVAISVVRKDPLSAILNAISMIPLIGDVIGKGTKALLKALVNKGIKSVQFLGRTYAKADLAAYLKGKIDPHDAKIKEVLNAIDMVMGQRAGTMYAVYAREVKTVIYKASTSVAPAASTSSVGWGSTGP